MLILRWRDWLTSFERERRRCARWPRFRPLLERLEDRWAPATLTVTSTADTVAVDGFVTLREAIASANGNASVNADVIAVGAYGFDTIEFNIPTADAGFQEIVSDDDVFQAGEFWSIKPSSALPTITDAVIIAGHTQPGFTNAPIIELDGSNAGVVNGLTINGQGSTIRGLIINRFGGAGIRLNPDSSGLSGNLIQGNYIGTDASGTLDLGNGRSGVEIVESAGNTIGGTTSLERNVISGNENVGVAIYGGGADQNLVQGNYIGTDVTGGADLGNSFQGVYIGDGSEFSPAVTGVAANNTVGGLTAIPGTGPGNLISGNDNNGVWINGGKADKTGAPIGANVVLGNLIGTDSAGTSKIPNARVGVLVIGSGQNTIGGADAQARNVISGNGQNGVAIYGQGADNNLVQHNFVGTNITGDGPLGNLSTGVLIGEDPARKFPGSATHNKILGNVLSANGTAGVNGEGVEIAGIGADFNVVQGNLIGTDASGTQPLGNLVSGVQIVLGAAHNTIGGTSPAARNIIADNGLDGVNIFGSDTKFNVVAGNYIGTDINGDAMGNARHGVALRAGTSDNTIGGTSALTRNLISGNSEHGVRIDEGSTRNLVASNYIGTDFLGTTALANLDNGVHISEAPDNTIGGSTAGLRNIISGNGANGVVIEGEGSFENLVIGNFIGTDRTGTVNLGNFDDGVVIRDGAQFNIIGGSTQPTLAGGQGNVISGNNFGFIIGVPDSGTGVVITGAGTDHNLVQGNFIGVDVTGNRPLPNNGDGVALLDLASNNTIGGAGQRGNVISANIGNGVGIYDSASDNRVQGNRIGIGRKGGILGNAGSGVLVSNAFSNTIGGLASTLGNIIAVNNGDGTTPNDGAGVTVDASFETTILSNSIFKNGGEKLGLGIDLVGGKEDDFGVTANDDDNDFDDGDGLLNFPVLTSAQGGSVVTIAGTLTTTSETKFLLQFFGSSEPDPSNHGEGQFLIGSGFVTTNGDGFARFRFTFARALPAGTFISSTATAVEVGDGLPGFAESRKTSTFLFFGETSEFSEVVVLTPGPTSDPRRDPLELTPFLPPPDPISRGGTSGALELDTVFVGDDQRRFLQSVSRIQEQTLGSGEPRSALLGALFNGEIGGGLFDDFNGNGKLDPGELPLIGQIVYLDANDDGKLDDDEWWTITNKRGEYRFQNLPPGRYIVRPVTAYETTVSLLNKGYQVKRMPPMLTTAPVTGRQQTELTSQQRTVVDLNFTARVRPDVRPFTPINPAPDKTAPTGPQGRLDRPPQPDAEQAVAAEAQTAADPSTPRE